MRTFFFGYVGGKSKDLKYIMPSVNLDGIKTVIEPFCGSCAFSSHLDKKNLKFCFNDIDSNLIYFLKDVKCGKFPEYIKYYNEHYKDYMTDGKPNQLWYDLKKEKDIPSKKIFLLKRLSGKGSMVNLKSKDQKINEYDHLVKLFKKADLQCGEYKKIIDKYMNDETAFLFLDPPYLDSYNSSYSSFKGISTNETHHIIDNTTMFIEFLDILKNAKCKIMLVINGNALTKYLYKDFIKTTYEKRYDISGRKTEHLIITNY